MTDGLADHEIAGLHGLLSKVMANAVRTKSGGAWICRLCDLTACERELGGCPAANTAQMVHGDGSNAQSASAWNQRVDALETEVARTRAERRHPPQGNRIDDASTKEDTA